MSEAKHKCGKFKMLKLLKQKFWGDFVNWMSGFGRIAKITFELSSRAILPVEMKLPYSQTIWSDACESQHLSGYSQRTASMLASLAVHSSRFGRDCASSHLSSGLSSYRPRLMLIQLGNSSIETCALSCTDSSHLVFNYPTLRYLPSPWKIS